MVPIPPQSGGGLNRAIEADIMRANLADERVAIAEIEKALDALA